MLLFPGFTMFSRGDTMVRHQYFGEYMESLLAKENLPVDICCFCDVKGISGALCQVTSLVTETT